MTELHPYMGYNKADGSGEDAILIFARTSTEARKLGWSTMKALRKTNWPVMAVRRLVKNVDYLRGDADQEKLAANIPHVITDMRSCPSCELWGEERDGTGCGYCDDQH